MDEEQNVNQQKVFEDLTKEKKQGKNKEPNMFLVTLLIICIVSALLIEMFVVRDNAYIKGLAYQKNLLEEGIDKCRSNDAVLFIGRSMNGTLSMDCVTTFKYNESMPNKSLDNPGANI